MARTYKRDSKGRFAGGGGAARRRQVRAKAGTSAASPRLQRNPVSGTAKPPGTISGTKYGRSVDQFSREAQSMMGRKIGPKVKQRASTLKERAAQAGLKNAGRRTTAPRTLRDVNFGTSAPKGTIPKSDPSSSIGRSIGGRRTLIPASTTRPPRRSKAAAVKAAAANGRIMRGSFARLRRNR